VTPETPVKAVVTVGASALLVARIVRPQWNIDATALGFLAVAILPWLSSIFESIQFPGGGGVTFRAAVERAKESGDAIIAASPPSAAAQHEQEGRRSGTVTPVRPVMTLTTADPNLAFVALRIDLERALRNIANRHGINGRTTRELVRNLIQAGVVPDDVGTALNNLIYVGNQAAHGKPIDEETGHWAREHGSEILSALERIAGRSISP
jgi:hypothetical protein